jgi:hypothetical protein
MSRKLEYDGRVRRASIAGLAAIGWMFLGASLAAQINAAPPSVTSLGFGGRAINGASPSVTSLGPHGYNPGSNPAFPNSRGGIGAGPNASSNGHHPHRNDGPYGGVVYAVPYYGYYDNGNSDDATNQADDDQYNGGPTIFDRRGPGYVYRPPADDYADRQPAETAAVTPPEATPTPSQPQTLLVFKDGHQLEVENYAIVGSTLYDLTEGHRRRIGLSDLDLVATAKQNDDRGIDFRVPAGSE